ncbi:MAG: hypothetical protein JXR94_14155, partial [Candidatus Hydrogenedentes bacterium]|nr:hypothetical protein [Candidatus Hydrogenedentota bacterium]
VAVALALAAVWGGLPRSVWAEADGFLTKEGVRLFPIGFYELPEDEAALEAMADAGVNLVHCHSRADLDRVQAEGMQGVFPLALQQGATDALREQVAAVADHPALAVWEGPDEVVWNFTAYSGLYRTHGVHKTKGAWWAQAPEAVAYAEEKAAEIIPNMRAAAALVRELDALGRPLWINEAQKSDVYYVRQYLDFVDITGCDIYPVNETDRSVERVADALTRWHQVGRGRPVYMVLQGFSWHALGDYYGHKKPAYPSFAESRFMAYDVIARGARGILYWGSRYLDHEPFRRSLYALTSELAALHPFLVAPDAPGVTIEIVEMPRETPPQVQVACRQAGEDWLVILVNEDEVSHMGVVIEGLGALEGRMMHQLYGPATAPVLGGEFVARLQPRDVQVFATARSWESPNRDGRDFGAEPAE